MARVRAFRRLQPPTSAAELLQFVTDLQENVADAMAMLAELPLLDFVHKRGVSLTAGATNQVPHGLARPWRGFIVTRRNAAVVPYAPDAQALPERLLDLQVAADVTVDLFVF